MTKILPYIVLIVIIILSSCELDLKPYDSPYTITSSSISFESSSSTCFTKGGITINLQNNSSKSIQGLGLYYRIYTVKDNKYYPYPDFSTNIVSDNISIDISANAKKDVCISLDSKLGTIPSDKLAVSPFVIRKIHYSDSSVWEDKYDIYKISIQ